MIEHIISDLEGCFGEAAGNKPRPTKEGEYVLNWLAETLAFSSVGILCLSDASVFSDDSAQLMFAHYGRNNTGLALVYEANGADIHEIEYTKQCGGSGGATKRILNWCNGDFNQNEMDDFLLKSEKWGYEKEHRIFAEPGFAKVEKVNLKLKAIFYTPKFNDFDTLNNINNEFYHDNDKLIMHEIFAAKDESCLFRISGGTETVWEYLQKSTRS